jgi:hypothetical protein
MVEHEPVVEVGAARADLFQRGVEHAELDDGSGGDRLVRVDRDSLAGGEVVRVEGDLAVKSGDLGLELRGERGIGLGTGGQRRGEDEEAGRSESR